MTDINYIRTIPLGKIYAWEAKKESSITPISFPGQNSGATEGVDTLGISQYFSIRGRYTGDFLDIQTYLHDIEKIADGKQDDSSSLSSPFVNGRTGIYPSSIRRQGNIGVNDSVSANRLNDSTTNFGILGIQVDDYVKNLVTEQVAQVTAVGTNFLQLDANIFTSSGLGYAVTATINCKVITINHRWELPGLSICNYDLNVLQVR